MRLYIRNHLDAQTFFEIFEPKAKHITGVEPASRQPIGELYRRVVTDPFRLGYLYELTPGGLWLDHVGMPGDLQYVNDHLGTLREASRRWLAAQAAGGGYDEFLAWLYEADPECKQRERDYPYTFWASEYGDLVDPFGPLE